MSEETPKPTAKPAARPAAKEAPTDQRDDSTELEPSDAEAPGPITPEHESGSWEQTQQEQEAREEAREDRK